MKVRTSVTLPEDLLVKIDRLTNKKQTRSAVIETALRDYVAKSTPKRLNQKDIDIINRNAELLNKQVEETLEFQTEW